MQFRYTRSSGAREKFDTPGIGFLRYELPHSMVQHSSTDGVGGRLREARERRGLSLRQISHVTKISVHTLAALERNAVTRLPGGIFSRAFVRAYAAEVGLDPEAIVTEFLRQFPAELVGAGHASVEADEIRPLRSERRAGLALMSVLALGIAALGLVVSVGLAALWTSREPAARVAPPLIPVVSARELPAALHPARPPAALRVPGRSDASDRVIVELRATAPCWVVATVDGERVLARELRPGERLSLDVGRALELTAGNAAALVMSLNGAEARPLGREGQVVTRLVTPGNVADLLARR